MTSRIVLWVAMVLALAGAVPGTARADWDDRPDPSEFEASLGPSGYWVDEPAFGRVWRPYAEWDWRPYTAGQWVWTSYGWTWDSAEPWGWTFHYGRWGFSNLYGWVWTPGYVWGPAWVDWYWGDGYVGWVPLGPPGFAVVPTYWTYVRDYSFCAPRVTDVVIVHDRLPQFIIHHREQGWGSRHAPDLRDIEQVSHDRIVRENDRPRGSVAPWVEHRLERGERVRERVADRGGERVIEHEGRVSERRDDGWRRQGDLRDDHGPMTGDARERGRGATDHMSEDRRGRGDRDAGRARIEDDGNVERRVQPQPRADDRADTPRAWSRAPSANEEERRGREMEHQAAPPPVYRGGGGFERGDGGGMPRGNVGMARGAGGPPDRGPGGGQRSAPHHGGGEWNHGGHGKDERPER